MGEAFITRRGGSAKVELKSIEVTTPPTKTTYFPGETFDPTDMVVMADLGCASIAVSGYTVSPTVMVAGVTSVTITYELAGVTKTTTQAVSVTTPSATLANNSWATINMVSAAGMASQYWNVGDEKTDAIDGTNYVFQIIGFDHDDLDSADPRYNDATYNGGSKKAGITFCMKDLYATTYYMNSSNTNAGGWNSSYMRQTVMPLLKGKLSASLQVVLRTVKKLAGTGGGSSSGVQSAADQLFLLSEIEIFGSTNYSVAGEGSQYAYYTAGNSKIKKSAGSAAKWWGRSPNSGNGSYFGNVESDGDAYYHYASNAYGVAAGFCV